MTKIEPLFRCQYYAKRTRKETLCESGTLSAALADANSEKASKAKVIIITRDSRGVDHPANAGLFFLHPIVK